MRGDEVRAPTAALKLKTFFIGEVKVCLIIILILTLNSFACFLSSATSRYHGSAPILEEEEEAAAAEAEAEATEEALST